MRTCRDRNSPSVQIFPKMFLDIFIDGRKLIPEIFDGPDIQICLLSACHPLKYFITGDMPRSEITERVHTFHDPSAPGINQYTTFSSHSFRNQSAGLIIHSEQCRMKLD